jgi:DNA-binding MltR family transcriptional regulator
VTENSEEILKLAKEAFAFHKTLSIESNRGVSLMSASYLEEELKLLLQKYFVQDKNALKEFFGFNGSLGTFSSKIEMAYLLGLIPKEARDDLNLIRKIRNECAHSPYQIDFQSNIKIKSLCAELIYDGLPSTEQPLIKCKGAAFSLLAMIHANRIATCSLTAPPGINIKQFINDRDKLIEVVKKEN